MTSGGVTGGRGPERSDIGRSALRVARTVCRLACAGVVAVGLTAAVAGDHHHHEFYHQWLEWKPCNDANLAKEGAECADVAVPLDYTDLEGRTMTVAISRVKAGDPTRRRGILLSNPGGPGASGLDALDLLGDVITPEVRAQYDVIGMDPRGVGSSGRSPRCGWRASEMIRSAGIDGRGFDAEVALAREMAAGCLTGDRAKLRQLTTRNTARDMDVVRSALHEPKISYYGLSYGTYLGAVFTQMFPSRSDRIVLDSAVDPDRYWTGLVQDWGPADEAALDDWAGWVAARDSTYHLGATGARVRARIEDLIRRAAHQPIDIDGFRLDDHWLPFVLHIELRSFHLNTVLADLVREIADLAHGNAPVAAHSTLRELVDALRTGEDSAEADIACADVGAPTDPRWYRRNIERTRVAQPVFGALAGNIQPCAFWPRPTEPPTVIRNAIPALILQAGRDTHTPYAEGVQLHRDMSGSRMVTVPDVRIHGTFRPGLSSCVNDTINRYLSDGALPGFDITCRPDPGAGPTP